MGLKLSDGQCLSKLKLFLSQVCRVLANMTPTRVKRGCVKIPACILARQPWPFGPQCLSSSKETQWVSGQRDTRFINLQQRGEGEKKFIFTETKGHLTFAFFITTNGSSSSLNLFLSDWNLGTCGVSGFYLNHKDCGCMLWILYDLTNTTVLRIGEINWSWNGPAGIFVHLGLGCWSLKNIVCAKTN